MKYIRHMMLYALGACLLIGNPTHAARASNGDIRLYINGREITGLPVPPVIHQNSALVPAREVFETLGAFVEWNAAEQKVLINYESELLVMKIGDVNAQLNGADVVMQIPPLLVEGKTMIPLRFPAECFDFEVSWNEAERAAYIYAPPKPAAKPEEVLYDEDGFDEDADSGDGAPEEEVSGDAESDADGFGDGSDAVIVEQETDYIDESERARDVSQAEITAMEYDEASIIEFLTPKETSSTLYVAVASSPISNVTRFLLPDNRLVVDIHNSSCEIYGPFFMDETVPLDDIRASQFSKEPMTTRIVFEISGAAEFAISLSEDRTELTVSFGKTTVADVSFSTNGISDTITITSAGTNAPTVRLVPGTDPTRVDIIIENAEMDFTIYENTSGAFVTRLSSFKREGGAICVEARLNSFPSFRLEYGQDSVSIILYPNTYQNIWYRQANRTIYITKTPLFNMDVFQIQHQDDYHELRYTLTLPIDAEFLLGSGELFVGDSLIHSVIIERARSGATRLVINENRVLAYSVSETDEYYTIRAHLPREIHPFIVVVDPGHGGADPGTQAGGYNEKDINLSVALKLMQLLDADPTVKAYSTRLTDITYKRDDRPVFANMTGDLFVSIHANSAANRYDTRPYGIETWYHPHQNDSAIGFSCWQLAEIINRNALIMMGAFNRGLKTDELVVLRETTIPAVLFEMGFMSNPPELSKLLDDNYQWLIARALYNGIKEAQQIYKPAR